MEGIIQNEQPSQPDLEKVDFLPVFDRISDGVIIVNNNGIIVYYNDAMSKIDDTVVADALGKKVTDIYDLDNDTSMIMRCLNTGLPIIDRPFMYHTRMGKVANTLHNAFPLRRDNRQIGAICFVRDYNVLEETISAASIPRKKSSHGEDTRFTFDSIIGDDPEFRHAVNMAIMASATSSPVMLFGETGSGKELFAQAIHNRSARSKQRYTPINCAAIPENLLEGILFGTSRGAFTGAQNKPGLFERTNGGTLFLDEVNSMPVNLQTKILRVIQERKVRRLGALREVKIDLKIVSSVNQEPHLAIEENSLRSDLFYRLGVVFIPIPPLRERPGDIERLVRHFINKHNSAMGKLIRDVCSDVMTFFQNYHWPGNVRELEHLIEGAMNLVGQDNMIRLKHIPSHLTYRPGIGRQHLIRDNYSSGSVSKNDFGRISENNDALNLANFTNFTNSKMGSKSPVKGLVETQAETEKNAVESAIARYRGNVTRAAESLGISRQLLHYKLKKYRIERRTFI